jgi:hypothetical protein
MMPEPIKQLEAAPPYSTSEHHPVKYVNPEIHQSRILLEKPHPGIAAASIAVATWAGTVREVLMDPHRMLVDVHDLVPGYGSATAATPGWTESLC